MVGDVKQSIYQFRLADPDIFLQKYHAYENAQEATAGQGRKVLLSHNFRSGGEVIEAVNDVFSTCMTPKVGGLRYGEAEALREGVPHTPLNSPGTELYALEIREDTYQEEAAFVADTIRSKTLIHPHKTYQNPFQEKEHSCHPTGTADSQGNIPGNRKCPEGEKDTQRPGK